MARLKSKYVHPNKVARKEYLEHIKKEKEDIVKYGTLGLKFQKKKEEAERNKKIRLKEKIKQDFPDLENLFRIDEHFSKKVSKLIVNMHLISVNKSNAHTIRTLRTTARNQQQSVLRKSIVKYAQKRNINSSRTEQWLFLRE